MAAERSKRQNAGSRMGNLLETEEEDEVYKTLYGGFEEVAEDNDYRSEDSDSDSTDSDISLDENDEVRSDADDDDEPKRKKRVVTKAYKEPKRETPEVKKVKVEVKKEKQKKKDDIPSVQIYQSPERKSVRRSTALKSKQTQSRQKLREQHAKLLADIADKKKVKVEDVRRLTQEELLEEAKITEQINLKSLETYEKLELEKKRTRVQKQTYRGPIIRYHSVTMPLLSEDSCVDPEINVDGDGDAVADSEHTSSELCSRTFVTFTDQNVFHAIFPQSRRKAPQRLVCPVTRLPAKYVDPITQTPYASLQAFRLIREAYTKQLAQEGGSKASNGGTPSAPASQAKRKDRAPSIVNVTE